MSLMNITELHEGGREKCLGVQVCMIVSKYLKYEHTCTYLVSMSIGMYTGFYVCASVNLKTPEVECAFVANTHFQYKIKSSLIATSLKAARFFSKWKVCLPWILSCNYRFECMYTWSDLPRNSVWGEAVSQCSTKCLKTLLTIKTKHAMLLKLRHIFYFLLPYFLN